MNKQREYKWSIIEELEELTTRWYSIDIWEGGNQHPLWIEVETSKEYDRFTGELGDTEPFYAQVVDGSGYPIFNVFIDSIRGNDIVEECKKWIYENEDEYFEMHDEY
jgi:hypothetical protein